MSTELSLKNCCSRLADATKTKDRMDALNALRVSFLNESDHASQSFEEYTKNKIRDEIGQFLWTATKRRPMVLPVIIEV